MNISRSYPMFLQMCQAKFYKFQILPKKNSKILNVHLSILPTYRVFHPSCHPLISLCAGLQKNIKVLNWPPPIMVEARTYCPQNMAESRTCHPLNAKFCTLVTFRGGNFLPLPFLGGGQFRTLVIFLDCGWQEG